MALLHIQCLVMDSISSKLMQQKLEHKNFQLKSSNNSLDEKQIYQEIMFANYATLLQENNNDNGSEKILRRTSLPIALTSLSSMTTPKSDGEIKSPTSLLLNNDNDEWDSTDNSIFVNCDQQNNLIKYHNTGTSTDMIFYFDTAISSLSPTCHHHNELKNYSIDNQSNEYDNTDNSFCSIASTSSSGCSSSQITQSEYNQYQNYPLSSPLQISENENNINLATSTTITTNSSIIPPSVIITDHSLVDSIIYPLKSVCNSLKIIIHSINFIIFSSRIYLIVSTILTYATIQGLNFFLIFIKHFFLIFYFQNIQTQFCKLILFIDHIIIIFRRG